MFNLVKETSCIITCTITITTTTLPTKILRPWVKFTHMHIWLLREDGKRLELKKLMFTLVDTRPRNGRDKSTQKSHANMRTIISKVQDSATTSLRSQKMIKNTSSYLQECHLRDYPPLEAVFSSTWGKGRASLTSFTICRDNRESDKKRSQRPESAKLRDYLKKKQTGKKSTKSRSKG